MAKPPETPDSLLDQYLDRMLSSDKEKALVRLLREPEHQERILFLLGLEGKLQEELSPQSERIKDSSLAEDRSLSDDSTATLKAMKSTARQRKTGEKRFRRALSFQRKAWARNPSFYPWISIAAACIVAIVGVLLIHNRPSRMEMHSAVATISTATNDVHILRHDKTIPARSQMDILHGDQINIPESSEAAVQYLDENSVIRLFGNTQAEFRKDKRLKQVVLSRGELHAVMAPQVDGNELIITTPKAEVRVVGTEFRLLTDSNATNIQVTEGTVFFTRLHDRRTIQVSAGETAIAKPGIPLVAEKPTLSKPPQSPAKKTPKKTDAEQAEEYHKLALIQRNNLDLDNAEKSVRKAMDLNPKRVCFRHTLASILFEKGDFTGSLRERNICLETNINKNFVPIDIFLCESMLKQPSSRLADYRKIWPDNEWPGPAMDLFLEKISPNQYLSTKISPVQYFPATDPGYKASKFYYLGEYYFLKNNLPKAREYFQKAAVIDSNWADTTRAKIRLIQLDSKK